MHNTVRKALWGWLCLGLLVLAGCSARHIRDAQDSFNRAAAAENRLFADGYTGADALATEATAETDYRLALASVRSELKDNEAELRSDGLLGTARMLEVYCLWRLVALEDGAEQVEALETELNGLLTKIDGEKKDLRLGHRDSVMLDAFPALLDHEKGLRATGYDTAEGFFESAASELGKLAEGLPEQSTVRTYLRLAQLSSLRAWYSAAFVYHGTGRATTIASGIAGQAKPVLKEVWFSSKNRALVQALAMRFGINDPTK